MADDLAPILRTVPPSPEEYLPFFRRTSADEIKECSFDFVVALAARGFVILTGQSGTGKSRTVIHLGRGLNTLGKYEVGVHGSSYELVPVGADWTDARPLIGYTNPFGPPRQNESGEVTHVTYEIPPSLRLLLRSASPSAAGIPWLLVLDEMNLSHVERYFSPFLSLIEANRSSGESDVMLLSSEKLMLIANVLQQDEPGARETAAAQELVEEGTGLPIPANLMVIGTVNVDETTYMFSPKVLDRAHVLEMHSISPAAYFANEVREESTMPIQAAFELLCWSIQSRMRGLFDQHPNEIFQLVKETAEGDAVVDQIQSATQRLLDGAYTLLDPIGFGFGFRTINEVSAYLLCWVKARMLMKAGLDDWGNALDRAFVQKILPKIHGNRRQLGESLAALDSFLAGNDEESEHPAKYRLGGGDTIGIKPEDRIQLPAAMNRSRTKLQSMHAQLHATGYATFIR